MNTSAPPTYMGPPLGPEVASLLAVLERYGFTHGSTGPADKTLNIYLNGKRCAYINSTVVRFGGVVGYHFARWGRPANDCPSEFAETLSEEFQRRYGCDAGEIFVQSGTGSNTGRKYLIIKSATLALRVMCQDSGVALDEGQHITLRGGKYTEGTVREVQFRTLERSPAARQRCLDIHGFDCWVCKVNIRARYGLEKELIHVHHEIPLGANPGPRETDPEGELKPLCPNCHAVVHSRKQPYSLEEVRQMLGGET